MPLTSPKLRVVVLISGSGSNLQALIDAAPASHYEIVAVLANKADAYGLQRAKAAGIPTHCIDHQQFPEREAFDLTMINCLTPYQPQLVVLAGFMRILSSHFVNHYSGHMLNIHPSLLPKYRGLNTHQRALDAGDNWHGVSVHFVTEELDGGPIILQARVPITAQDDATRLAKRIQQQEHLIYPLVVNWYAQARLCLSNGQAVLDHTPIDNPLLYEDLTPQQRAIS